MVPLMCGLIVLALLAWKNYPPEVRTNLYMSVAASQSVLAFLYGLQAHVEVIRVGHVPTLTQLYATTVISMLFGALMFVLLTATDLWARSRAIEAMEEYDPE